MGFPLPGCPPPPPQGFGLTDLLTCLIQDSAQAGPSVGSDFHTGLQWSACDGGSEGRNAGTWEQLSPEQDPPIQAVPLELGSSLPSPSPTAAFLLCQGLPYL